MNLFVSSVQAGLRKGLMPILLSPAVLAFAQNHPLDSLAVRDIEVVKIVKINSHDKNKSKISPSNTDLLNHDAGRFLNALPEISGIRKAGNYATDPVLRGFKYEQLNIVIDGAANAVNACPSRMDPAVSQINMNMVQEAEIFKGPYHFRNGSSFGGTVNFITMKPVFTEKPLLNGRITTGFESNGSIFRNEIFTEVSSKKIVWDLFGSYQTGNRYTDGDGNEVPSAFLRYSVGTKGNFKWNDGQLTTFQINTNQGRDVEFAALQMDLIYDKTWMLQLKHLAAFNGSFFNQLDVNTYYSVVDHSMGTANRSMVSDVKSVTYGGRAELKKSWEGNILYTGVDYKHEQAENIRMVMPMMPGMTPRDGSAWQNAEIAQLGWFAEYQRWFLGAKFTASARLDYNMADAGKPSELFRKLYGNISAEDLNHHLSLGYTKNLNDNSQLALWLGRAQRSGSLTERYINLFVVGNDNYEVLGNPHLKPETNTQTDLIYSYTRGKVFFQANVFYSRLDDYISGIIRRDIMPASMMSPGVRQMQNTNRAMKTGFESRLNWKILPQLTSEMAVAYTYAEDLDTKMPLPEVSPLDIRWKLQANLSPVTIAANLRYAAAQNRVNPDFGELKTPDFFVANLSARYALFRNAYLDAEITNLFDRAYAEHLSRTRSDDKSRRIFERGRSFNIGFTCSF